MGTLGDGYRCPRPSANRLENSWEMGLAAAAYLLSTSRFTPPPPPTHKPAPERSFDLQGFLLRTIMGGRWLRGAGGAQAYKGGRDSNFETNQQPAGAQRSRARPEEAQLRLQVVKKVQLRLLLP